jgi:thiosulfate reductase cytochrome b subunit
MTAGGQTTKRRLVLYRHPVVVRLTHWIGVLCVGVLIASGLQIFNAHPGLYLGQRSTFARPIFSIVAEQTPTGALAGRVRFGQAISLPTTGVLGVSRDDGQPAARAFPHWATLPGFIDLATGRRWHFFFAWIFVANLALMLGYGLVGGRYRRMLALTRRDLADIPRSIWRHLQLKFPHGEEARSYNVLQKLAYLAVIALFLPLMVLTGLSMSPGVDAAAAWLPALFGGRQSARTLHFIIASGIVLFIAVHLVMVLVSGVFNNLRSMITGGYAIRLDEEAGHAQS